MFGRVWIRDANPVSLRPGTPSRLLALPVLPINKILLNYRDQIVHNRKPKPQSASASSVSPGTVSILSASEDARMLTLLTRWQEMHRWRIIAGLGAWSLSLAAIVVSV